MVGTHNTAAVNEGGSTCKAVMRSEKGFLARAATALKRDRAEAASWSAHYERKQRNRSHELHPRKSPRGVGLFVTWRADVSTLIDLVEMATDWGPFELTSITPMRPKRSSNAPIYRCWFDYHGPDREFELQKQCLLGCVQRVADAEEDRSLR